MLNKIRREKPLILNITNMVTMDFIANGLLSLGASPIMSLAEQEADDLVKISHAVVINIGTLDSNFLNLAKKMAAAANHFKKPIILDPVGAGASVYRTQSALDLLNQYSIDIIRGNASEIMVLAGQDVISKGVDTTETSLNATEAGKLLSQKYNSAVVISGETDVVIDRENINTSHYGSPIMTSITGTGCLLSAVVAAFRAVENNRFNASVEAVKFYGQCGEVAAHKSAIPTLFKNYFLEALHVKNLTAVCA